MLREVRHAPVAEYIGRCCLRVPGLRCAEWRLSSGCHLWKLGAERRISLGRRTADDQRSRAFARRRPAVLAPRRIVRGVPRCLLVVGRRAERGSLPTSGGRCVCHLDGGRPGLRLRNRRELHGRLGDYRRPDRFRVCAVWRGDRLVRDEPGRQPDAGFRLLQRDRRPGDVDLGNAELRWLGCNLRSRRDHQQQSGRAVYARPVPPTADA
jgi:hypothetical protein